MATVVVAKWEDEFDRELAERVLSGAEEAEAPRYELTGA